MHVSSTLQTVYNTRMMTARCMYIEKNKQRFLHIAKVDERFIQNNKFSGK